MVPASGARWGGRRREGTSRTCSTSTPRAPRAATLCALAEPDPVCHQHATLVAGPLPHAAPRQLLGTLARCTPAAQEPVQFLHVQQAVKVAVPREECLHQTGNLHCTRQAMPTSGGGGRREASIRGEPSRKRVEERWEEGGGVDMARGGGGVHTPGHAQSTRGTGDNYPPAIPAPRLSQGTYSCSFAGQCSQTPPSPRHGSSPGL